MKKRILVIDDDASVREALEKILMASGYAVELASDGREGAERLEKCEFDLLVLDLDLPELSGFDLLDIIAMRAYALPVLILTGMADKCDSGAVAGADALLQKPPDVWLLMNTIERLLTLPSAARMRTSACSMPPAHPLSSLHRNSLLLWRSPTGRDRI